MKKIIICLTILIQGLTCFAQTNMKDTIAYFPDGKIKLQIVGDTCRAWNFKGEIWYETIILKNGDEFTTLAASEGLMLYGIYNLYGDTILKTEITNFKNRKNDLWTIYFTNGNYETGIKGKYFWGHYRKREWKQYSKDEKLIAVGKYKKYILLRQPMCGTEIEPYNRHGKWTFYNSAGELIRLEYYKKGKLVSTKRVD